MINGKMFGVLEYTYIYNFTIVDETIVEDFIYIYINIFANIICTYGTLIPSLHGSHEFYQIKKVAL